jgi:hypothetical protein
MTWQYLSIFLYGGNHDSFFFPAAVVVVVDAKQNPTPWLMTLLERPARKLANQLNPLTPTTETIRRGQPLPFWPTPFDDVQDGSGSSSSYYLPGPKLWRGSIRADDQHHRNKQQKAYCGLTYDCAYDLSTNTGLVWQVELLGADPTPRQIQCVLFDGQSEWHCTLLVPAASATTTSVSLQLPFADFDGGGLAAAGRLRTESILRIRLLYGATHVGGTRNRTFRSGDFELKIHGLSTY